MSTPANLTPEQREEIWEGNKKFYLRFGAWSWDEFMALLDRATISGGCLMVPSPVILPQRPVTLVSDKVLGICKDDTRHPDRNKDIPDFEEDCLAERGRVLTGLWAHYCGDWDGMTMDETCPEFDTCSCTILGAPPRSSGDPNPHCACGHPSSDHYRFLRGEHACAACGCEKYARESPEARETRDAPQGPAGPTSAAPEKPKACFGCGNQQELCRCGGLG